MNIFAIAITLLVVLMLVLVITNLFSKSRNPRDSYHMPYDGTHYDNYSASAIHHHSHQNDRGDWGGRDMSHDHQDAGDHGGFDGGGDSGGDAGGGEGGGGAE